jgi:hypothetical protein
MRAASLIRGAWVQSQQLQAATQRIVGSSGLQGLHSLSGEEQQQQQQQTPVGLFHGQRPSLASLLGKRNAMPALLSSFQAHGMSSAPSGGQVGGNSWTKYREASGGIAKPNSLGGAYYALIVVFGFGAMTKDLYAFPPRVLGVMGLVFLILYARR